MPVFDADVALGRRHDRRVAVDSVEGTLEEMDRSGVDRAHVYAPHAAGYDSTHGNELLVRTDCWSRTVEPLGIALNTRT